MHLFFHEFNVLMLQCNSNVIVATELVPGLLRVNSIDYDEGENFWLDALNTPVLVFVSNFCTDTYTRTWNIKLVRRGFGFWLQQGESRPHGSLARFPNASA